MLIGCFDFFRRLCRPLMVTDGITDDDYFIILNLWIGHRIKGEEIRIEVHLRELRRQVP